MVSRDVQIPLLGEVCVSPYMSAVEYPVILTHEYAHTAGIIREREADFYAFVGGSRSPCALLRYAILFSMRARLCEAAKKAGIDDAWEQAGATLPDDVQGEIVGLAELYRQRAFAPGGRIELKPTPETQVVAVTEGEAPGSAPIAVYRAVSASAGLPLDYDSCLPLVALWVLQQRELARPPG